MLLLGFLCAIILQKHRIDWLFKKSPSQAAFKHLERGGAEMVFSHLELQMAAFWKLLDGPEVWPSMKLLESYIPYIFEYMISNSQVENPH